jgi:hypothetical protein
MGRLFIFLKKFGSLVFNRIFVLTKEKDMKKVILLLVAMFGMVSFYNSVSPKQSKLDLLTSASEMSSLNYTVTMRKYLIKHNTDVISFRVLDSLRHVSDKRCDSILSRSIN